MCRNGDVWQEIKWHSERKKIDLNNVLPCCYRCKMRKKIIILKFKDRIQLGWWCVDFRKKSLALAAETYSDKHKLEHTCTRMHACITWNTKCQLEMFACRCERQQQQQQQPQKRQSRHQHIILFMDNLRWLHSCKIIHNYHVKYIYRFNVVCCRFIGFCNGKQGAHYFTAPFEMVISISFHLILAFWDIICFVLLSFLDGQLAHMEFQNAVVRNKSKCKVIVNISKLFIVTCKTRSTAMVAIYDVTLPLRMEQ